jgi:spore maturation protein CgeB
MNVVFLKSKTFLAQEVENALKKRRDIQLITTAIPEQIPSEHAPSVFGQIKPFLPALVISINNAGTDFKGTLGGLIESSGSYHCNWFLDDPFYEDTFYNRKTTALKNRLDFMSEESFIPKMIEKGHKAFFLPLAVDPLYFNLEGTIDLKRDIAFVGNSSLEWLDTLITEEVQKELEKFAPLITTLKTMYYKSPCTADLKAYLLDNPAQWENKTELGREKFLFMMEWLVGYFYRRDFIIDVSKRFKDRFTCFGDIYWSRFIDQSQVSTDACYYTNLCSYYRSTRVNLNINRIQVKTSFTQRIFDCKASGAFVLTEKRPLNSRYFITEGLEKELVEFSSKPQCMELIDYYCEHDDERQRIALAGREKVLKLHTYDARIDLMLETCRKEWGI